MAKPWELQNKLKELPIPTIYEMKEKARMIAKPEDKAFFVIAYLTAGRVTEIIRSLKKGNLVMDKVNGRDILLIRDMPNRKHKKKHLKDIPIPLDKEGEFVEMLKEYTEELPEGNVLFRFGKTTAWKKMMEQGFNPHWMRHIRLTHLVMVYDFNEQLLIRFAGWTDSRSAKDYMELRWKDILQKL